MPIIRKRGFGIPSPPIGPNHRASFDILHKKFTYRLLIGVCSGGQADAARPLHVLSSLVSICNHFNSPKNQRFHRQAGHSPAALPSDGATDDRFIGLNSPPQSRSCVINHRMAQTVKHKPGRVVLASYLSLQLCGTKPWRMRRHQISRPKPFLNGHMTTMHYRTRHRGSTPAAPPALIAKRLSDDPILPSATFWADESLRPPALRQVLQTGPVRRELPPILLQCFGKSWSPHTRTVPQIETLVKYVSILSNIRNIKFWYGSSH